MKIEKAYDYFSAYYEGSLETPLKLQMDRLFEANPRLRADFESFAASLADLELSRAEEIQVPEDLHERIVARLDRSIYESSRNQPAKLSDLWRRFALGGVAAVVLLGTGFAVLNRSGDNHSAASLAPVPASEQRRDALEIVATDEGTYLRFSSLRDDTIRVMRLPDASVQKEYPVSARTKLDVPLQNQSADPITLVISSRVSGEEVLVVVPGSARKLAGEGNGSLLEFANELSSTHGLAVLVDSTKRDAMLRWNLSSDSITQPETVPEGVTVELKDKLIRIRY